MKQCREMVGYYSSNVVLVGKTSKTEINFRCKMFRYELFGTIMLALYNKLVLIPPVY